MGDEPIRMKPASPEQAVFAEALERATPEARAAYLDAACGTDAALRRRVEVLLRAAENAGDFLEDPLTGLSNADTTQLVTQLISGKPGQYFGDYELLEEIARGGMGIVFKARQMKLDRIVAVKVILAGEFASKEQALRFRVEAESAARLQHPNIVRIHETGEQDGQPYFSMDYVEGGNLAALVREKPLPAKRAAGYVKTIAKAIHYAHEQGILHRDLKPSNVLIDHADQPRVTDFGLAKRMTKESFLTVTGEVMGSPSFMPPEQAGAKTKAGRYSDVYGLGAILFYLVTSRPPFVSENVAETLHHVLNTESVSPRLLNPSVPQDIATICLKCLEKEPAKRYQTAQELADELGRFLNDEPIKSRPVSGLEKLWRWGRRKPALAGMGIATTLLLLTVAIGSPIAALRIERERKQAEHNARSETLQRQRAEATLIRIEIERAENLLALDNPSRALAHLARLLRQQPTNRVVATRLLSVLSQRNFCLPTAPPFRSGKGTNAAIDSARYDNSWLAEIFRRDGSISRGMFSPDGQRAVTVDEAGIARIWDTRTGRGIGTPLHHDGPVTCAHFSADGARIVTAGQDNTARIWDGLTGDPFTLPLVHGAAVLWAEFSRDGGEIVTVCEDRTVRRWDASTASPISHPLTHTVGVKAARFSLDGSRLLIDCADRKTRIVSCSNSLEIASVSRSSRVSPDGRLVAGQGSAYECIVSEVGTSEPPVARLSHSSELVSFRFSPDGQILATASWDNTARLWNAHSGEPIGLPLKHDNWVLSVRFSADGLRLVTASRDKSARVWDVRTGAPLTEPMRHDTQVPIADFSPDGQHVLTLTDDGAVWLWGIRSDQPLTEPLRHSSSVRHVTFSPDGQRVATGSLDGTIRIWSARTGLPVTGWLPQGGEVWSLQFSGDGHLLAAASIAGNGRVQVWDTVSAQPLGAPPSRGSAYSARFSPDGKRVVTGSTIWDSVSGDILTSLKGTSFARYAEFSTNGQWVLTASMDGTTRVWEATTGQPLFKPLKHEGPVYWAEFSPDGERVATASGDKSARIWSTRTGQMLTKPLVHSDELREYYSVGFSPDGHWVATAAGNVAQTWNAQTGDPLTAPLRHDRRVNSVRFSPDGQRLVTACYDDTARVWDAATGHALGEPFRHRARVAYAEFSPDGQYVATASYDGTARIWEVPDAPWPIPTWLADLAEAVAGERTDPLGFGTVVPGDELFKLKQGLGESSGEDYYSRWAKWFFADNATRTLSPSSLLTVPEYIQRRREEDTPESLLEVIRLSPTNGLAFARLARHILAQDSKDNSRRIGEADFFSRQALQFSPNDSEVQRLRAEIAEKIGNSPTP